MPKDNNNVVVPLAKWLAGSRRRTISDLIEIADRVPPGRVLPRIIDSMRDLSSEELTEPLSPAQMRHLVLTAALINRLLFNLMRLPRDPQHLI
jgi:hypothetical protein